MSENSGWQQGRYLCKESNKFYTVVIANDAVYGWDETRDSYYPSFEYEVDDTRHLHEFEYVGPRT